MTRTSLLWHPHQKLWNWRLASGLGRLPGGRHLNRLVILADSLILFAAVVIRRLRQLGLGAFRRPRLPPRLLYIDCGLHKEGREVPLMAEWFGERLFTIGYEASPEYWELASKALVAIPNTDLRQQALVGPDHAGDTVRLYKSGGDGKADSLFAERGTEFDDVPAVRLSAVLAEQPDDMPVLLRMNIEGAELFVIRDLVEAGQIDRVAGFYGMWDDLSKIDPAADGEFRRLLRSHGVRPVTFNDRDLDYPIRLRAIRYDMDTSVAAWR